MKPLPSIRVGGLALIVGAIAFMAVFSFLATRFDYPTILDGRVRRHVPQRHAAVNPVAVVNNYLLPLWMIVFGVVLLRIRTPEATETMEPIR